MYGNMSQANINAKDSDLKLYKSIKFIKMHPIIHKQILQVRSSKKSEERLNLCGHRFCLSSNDKNSRVGTPLSTFIEYSRVLGKDRYYAW